MPSCARKTSNIANRESPPHDSFLHLFIAGYRKDEVCNFPLIGEAPEKGRIREGSVPLTKVALATAPASAEPSTDAVKRFGVKC